MTFSITQKLLRNNRVISSTKPSTSAIPFGLGESSTEADKCQRERRLCNATSPSFVIQKAYFHHQNISRFYIQTAHGILLEALQKSKVSEEKFIEELNVPDELKRLKAGSLKWLFAVWPTPRKSFSGLSSIYNYDDDGQPIRNLEPNGKKPQKLKQFQRPAAHSNAEQLHVIVDYLKHKNIAIRRLIKLPWLLSADPVIIEMSVERIQKMLKLNHFNVAISFANLSDSKLVEAAGIWRRDAVTLSQRSTGTDGDGVLFLNRIDLLAHNLKCQHEDVSDMMAKVNQLMTMPLEKLEILLMHLLEEGVKPEGIVNDPWVFVHNLSKMRSRIQILHEKGIQEFKPWVLRAPQRNFEKFLTKEIEELHLLSSHKNVKGFLQQKLNCDERVTSVMLKKVPRLQAASATKLNEMIEFLFSAGFSTKEIQDTPRILAHSVETISERLTEVLAVGKPVINLHLLCRTSKDYRAALRKLKMDAREMSPTPTILPPVE